MNIDISRFYQVFFDESAEHLDEMERLLVDVDIHAPDIEKLNAIFRAAHSIKGGSGSVGFSDMVEVTHQLETLLDRLRKGEMQTTAEMVDVFLDATDILKAQLGAHMDGTLQQPGGADAVCMRLRQLAAGAPPQPAATDPVGANQPSVAYLIAFALAGKQRTIQDSIPALLRELQTLGELEILEQPQAGKGNNKKSAKQTWKLRLTSIAQPDQVRDAFAFVLDPSAVEITAQTDAAADPGFGLFDEPVAAALPSAAPADNAGYGLFEPLPETTPPSASAEISAAPSPVEQGTDSSRTVDRRAMERRASERSPGGLETSSIRVSIEKVDQLINLVGELVITRAMLAQTISKLDPVLHESLFQGSGQLERNTRDLQESVMSIRMLPISFVFSRFPRVVRDLASKLNKQVELVTIGENTELDKGLIEKIADPLTHLVRNSLDHGIEVPEKRLAAGKPEMGTITLSATHQGGNIVIEVTDDGAGLNREKILAKARERGIPVSDAMPDSDVWMLIFEAGFSTAEVVTDVSGRGVGMDVVRRNITEMGGTVEIESAVGQGSKIRVRLPLTLAILDGMTVALGDCIFVIPLSLIVETLQPKPEDIKSITGQGQVVNVRGEYVPLIALHKIFNLKPQFLDPTQGVLVMIEDKGKKSALFIDALVGQQQVVIKSLETNYRRVHGVSGATIMGDGRVALILDVPALIKLGQTNG